MTQTRNAQTAALEALIEAHAIELKLPTVRRRFKALAREATRAQQTPVAYLGALLEAEMAERAERRERRRLIDARFPQIKRLEDFRFEDNPSVPQATIAASPRAPGSQTASGQRQVAELVEHDELGARVAADDASELAARRGLLQLVGEPGERREADPASLVAGADRERGREHRLAGAGVADQDATRRTGGWW